MPLSYPDVCSALDMLADRCQYVAQALQQVGYPPERVGKSDDMALVRIIVGQQLSTKAASTINQRLSDLLGDGGYSNIPSFSDDELRAVGMSRPKIRYLRALTDALLTGELVLADFPSMDDESVVKALTALPGFGRWSAHMYLLFNLQRTDVWPTGDLAVRVGISRMVGASGRLTEAELEQWGERWRPHRSALSLLAWHYYGATTDV